MWVHFHLQLLYTTVHKHKVMCTLNVSSKTLKQVEKFKYPGVVFTSDGRQNKEVIHVLVKKPQHYVRFTFRGHKTELSITAK